MRVVFSQDMKCAISKPYYREWRKIKWQIIYIRFSLRREKKDLGWSLQIYLVRIMNLYCAKCRKCNKNYFSPLLCTFFMMSKFSHDLWWKSLALKSPPETVAAHPFYLDADTRKIYSVHLRTLYPDQACDLYVSLGFRRGSTASIGNSVLKSVLQIHDFQRYKSDSSHVHRKN